MGDNYAAGAAPTIEARVARIEALLAAPVDEVRTKRLVVTDDDGLTRIVAEVVGNAAELRLDLPDGTTGSRTSVRCFANPGDAGYDLGWGLGVQLWVNGDCIDEITAWRDTDG